MKVYADTDADLKTIFRHKIGQSVTFQLSHDP